MKLIVAEWPRFVNVSDKKELVFYDSDVTIEIENYEDNVDFRVKIVVKLSGSEDPLPLIYIEERK